MIGDIPAGLILIDRGPRAAARSAGAARGASRCSRRSLAFAQLAVDRCRDTSFEAEAFGFTLSSCGPIG